MNLAPARVGALCALLGLVLALAAAVARERDNARLAARHFDTVARGVTDSIAARMHNVEFGLRGMRGIAIAQGALPTPEQVRRYAASRDVDREFPGTRGFGLIWRVPEGEQDAFVARMRAAGLSGFGIRQIAPHAGDRFVIAAIEPEVRNEGALGLDIASEPNRFAAALAAQESGSAAITAPITLVQASGQRLRSFLVLLPFAQAALRPGAAPGVAGWSYAPVVIDEVLATLHPPEDLVWIALRDANAGGDAVFYTTAGPEPQDPDLPAADIRMTMFNRQWIAHLRARPALVAELQLVEPELVGAVGLLMAALLGGVGYLLAQRRQRSRAQELERAERAAIVEATDDAIVGIRLDGSITEWNGGAGRLFGFPAAEVLGRPIREVLPAPGWLDEDAALFASIVAGRRVTPFETQRRHRDGSLVDVSLSAAPIQDAGGRLVALAQTFRDIRAAKQARRELEALNASLDRQVRERTEAFEGALRDLRNIVDALPSMIGYWDRRLCNRMANRAYAGWFDLAPEQLKGRRMTELISEDTYALNRPHVEAALLGEARLFERTLRRPRDGALMRLRAHYLPDVVDGVVQGFYVLVHELSENGQAGAENDSSCRKGPFA